ncbi:M23 family metallopeptidase [Arthrobacter sp. SAFR-014]|uniref:M23 family metallopeptidase n=1 Tax=unclassified Arthrobacter TaxID=235627 RepID=UPI003F7B5FA1
MTITFCYPYKRGTGWRSQGFRTNPGGNNPSGGHTGFDQAMDEGEPIYAPGDGIIRNSGWLTDNYMANPWWLTAMGGDILVLDCTDAFGRSDTMPTFIIAHLKDSIAEVGERVVKGQLIGISGNTGTATTGAHAHIEALPPNWDWNNGVYGRVDPELYFTEYPDELITITAQGAAAGPATPKELFTMAQYDDIQKQQGVSHQKLNNLTAGLKGFAAAVKGYAQQNQKWHGQSHAKLNAIKSVVDQLATGQNVVIDWDKVEAAAKAGAAEALDEKLTEMNLGALELDANIEQAA